MRCPNCNQPIPEGSLFCGECGAAISAPVPPVPPVPTPTFTAPVPPVYSAPEEKIPPEYKPLTAWQYFWLQVLFSIPVVGFVFLIVFSCSSANLNRRSFARSYWCALLVFGGTALLVLLICLAVGVNLLDL